MRRLPLDEAMAAPMSTVHQPNLVTVGDVPTADRRRIVVGTDGSATADRAFEEALEIAARFTAELHVVSVSPRQTLPAGEGLSLAVASDVYVDALASARDHRGATLADALRRAEARGVTAVGHGHEGDAAAVICRIAAEVCADQVVVGNQGMRGWRRFLPSVPKRIAHAAPCTVHVVATS